jgi:xanthine dehydrogenase YagR molybdenum-binding subunit
VASAQNPREWGGNEMTQPVDAIAAVTGQPLPRVDGRLKVTGAARYAADNSPAPPAPGLLHAALVCSTVSRGTVVAVDAAAAQREPDVIRVFDHFPGVHLPFDPGQVAFFGQPVAVVVARTIEAAAHGASLVTVRYTSAPHVTDIDSPQAVPHPGERQTDYVRGDPDGALARAHVISDLGYSIIRYNHNAMELPSTVASWDGNRLTVWDKAQGINAAQEAYGKAFGIPPDDVHVICPFIGGAFGSAGSTWPHQILTAYAARQLHRPVKLVLSRQQMYSGIGYRPTSRQRLQIAADPAGTVTAIVHDGRTESARYASFEDSITGPARFLYDSPNMRSTYRVVPLDVNVGCPMRGPGATPGAFVLESGIDDVAHRLGIDPVELRIRNEPGHDQTTGLPFSTRGLRECLTRGAAEFGWAARNPTPRAVRDGNELVGFGMAAAGYHVNRSVCDALVRVNADGTADAFSATCDMGPGTYTSMSQVIADGLGLPFPRVRFALGDSRFPTAPSHSGSRTMVSVGSAVSLASNTLRDNFVRTAVVDPGSPLHGSAPRDVAVVDGRMHLTRDPAVGESYQELLRRKGWPSMEAKATYTPDDADTKFSMYAYGAVFAEVGVDEAFGTVRVRRVFGCYDGGRIINPRLAHSQAIGAMVMGIGMALLEGTEIDHRDGRLVNANMSDYLVPVNADVPKLDAIFLPGEDTVADPIGVKGLGELVIVAVPPAIGNAVFNATGRRVTELPITLDKLL